MKTSANTYPDALAQVHAVPYIADPAHTTAPSALVHAYAPNDPGRLGEKVVEGIDLLTGDNDYDTYATEKIAHHLEHEQTRVHRHARRSSRWGAWFSQMGSVATYTNPSDTAMM